MRRYLFLSCVFLGIAMLTLAVWAQDGDPDGSDAEEPLTISNPPAPEITGVWKPVELEQVQSTQQPFVTTALPASDVCGASTPALTFSVGGGGDGGPTKLLDVPASEDPATDPMFPSGCTWGNPSSSQGYRTVWYKFVAPSYGWVTIDTFGSDYDTIVSVYQGVCPTTATLPVACSDDHRNFAARARFLAEKDETYFIEVADWQESPPGGGGSLSLFANMQAVDSKWLTGGVMPLARSRHATVVVGNSIYVIGGQSGTLGAQQVETQLERFNTKNGNWVTLKDKPGTSGYANTTAAYVDGPNDAGRIYLPSGYTGNNSQFDGTHYVYNISSNQWMTATSAPWPNGKPIAWSAAVANPSENGYYLTGGISSQPPFATDVSDHDEVFFYSVASDSWTTMAPMTTTRYAHTAALVNGQICVAGGLKRNPVSGQPNILLTNGECYSPAANSWRTITDMVYPRYAAGSAVAPDGKWYVFGGIDAFGVPVPATEVYDPVSGTWSELGVRNDLGGGRTGLALSWPSRAWPRGGFVGPTLWAIGGNNAASEALPFVEKLFIGSEELLMPVIMSDFSLDIASDDTLRTARPLLLGQPQRRNFDTLQDLYDVYFFDLTASKTVNVSLTNIPSGSDYNVALYSANKFLWGASSKIGHADEHLTLFLSAGRYYVVVERFSPVGDPDTDKYRIEVK